VKLADEGTISAQAAKKVFSEMLATGADPEQIVEKRNLRSLDDADALHTTAETVVADHPDEARRYRDGETKLLAFFMGQFMRETRGKADAKEARTALQEVLAT
jgi:Asp-tRNA(Asn)/Glu-tRNA(Gln) amidotransferase B subunit